MFSIGSIVLCRSLIGIVFVFIFMVLKTRQTSIDFARPIFDSDCIYFPPDFCFFLCIHFLSPHFDNFHHISFFSIYAFFNKFIFQFYVQYFFPDIELSCSLVVKEWFCLSIFWESKILYWLSKYSGLKYKSRFF